MSRTKWFLCNLILKLDHIPRYGRLYPYRRDPSNPDGPLTVGKPYWRWWKKGRWGFYMLDRLGWLWPHIAESERRARATPRSLRDGTDQGD